MPNKQDQNLGPGKKEETAAGERRRSMLKKILLSSGAVATANSTEKLWSKPLADFVVLPAHANTTSNETDNAPGATPA